MALTDNSNISPGYRTDHSLLELSLSITDFKKGKGFWKFNNSLLRDKVFVDKVKQIINLLKEQYAASPYDRANITTINNEE